MTDSVPSIEAIQAKIGRELLKHGYHPSQIPTDQLRSKIATLIESEISDTSPTKRATWEKIINQTLELVERNAGGVYSDIEILGAIRRGHITLHPFIPQHIKGAQVDLTLGGDGFWVANSNKGMWYNPREQSEVERFFTLKMPSRHDEFCQEHGLTMMPGIPAQALVIPIYPQERVLLHTHEYVGILPPGTTTMHARSTWGRNGIAVCIDAGLGDPGYNTRWTLEGHNLNQEPVLLVVGERIAQVVFHKTGPVARPYGGATSKYDNAVSLEERIESWNPSMMLPRAFKDNYVAPASLEPIPDFSTVEFEGDDRDD
ncbi:MAG: deoxycytidine triphosphate deaminase [bacterium]